MTPSELKYQVTTHNTESHHFDRKTLKFFGDSMANYGIRATVVRTNYDATGTYNPDQGQHVPCWELYRRRPVKHGLKSSTYFAQDTFRRVYPSDDN